MTIEMKDSRRLTGPNLFWERPGAVADVACHETERSRLVEAWSDRARSLLDAVGWGKHGCTTRTFPGGVSLVVSAPMDGLYAATDVNEAALQAATASLDGLRPPDADRTADALRRTIANERNPALMRLQAAATAHGATFLVDDDHVSVGLGTGSLTWPVDTVPSPDGVDWSRVHEVPLALVTGTNGKSTTVRLVASMIRAAGLVPGTTSTDDIRVGDETIDSGDYAGPGGARTLLRRRSVEVAVLETARGGLLRRGLAVHRADVAAVTNVGHDHLGECGVADFDALVETKLIVHRAVGPRGVLLLNADDEALCRRAADLDVERAWFGLTGEAGNMRRAIDEGGTAAWLDGEALMLTRQGRREIATTVDRVPVALGGAARFNVANALAALVIGCRLGLAVPQMADGLAAFAGSRKENPGRGNLYELGGVKALVDFAHNPEGLRALFEMAARLPARRRLVVIGQAGDRDDASIRGLARVAWDARPDRVIIKEMHKYLRGRAAGVIPALLEAELRGAGAGDDVLERADSEIDAVRRALAWCRPGDFLLLTCHEARTEVLDLLDRLRAEQWEPGRPVGGP